MLTQSKIVGLIVVFVSFFSISSQIHSQTTRGKATFYANRFHGRPTSSGEMYHKDSFTCAHRTYPFGTILRVRDTKTNKEVYVKVNDRQHHGTTIDLSYAAARELNLISRGTAVVEITACKDLTSVPSNKESFKMPRLVVEDPTGDGYCLPSEWSEKSKTKLLQDSLAQIPTTKKSSNENDSTFTDKIVKNTHKHAVQIQNK